MNENTQFTITLDAEGMELISKALLAYADHIAEQDREDLAPGEAMIMNDQLLSAVNLMGTIKID